jgi:hypothetical protein
VADDYASFMQKNHFAVCYRASIMRTLYVPLHR